MAKNAIESFSAGTSIDELLQQSLGTLIEMNTALSLQENAMGLNDAVKSSQQNQQEIGSLSQQSSSALGSQQGAIRAMEQSRSRTQNATRIGGRFSRYE